MVMPKTLKINCPATANTSSTPAITQQASRAVRMRSCGVSVGVIARNAGTVASGSTMTKSELAASRMYSSRLTIKLEAGRSESQMGRIKQSKLDETVLQTVAFISRDQENQTDRSSSAQGCKW